MKLLPEDGALYVFVHSADHIAKERSLRKRQMKWPWARLAQLQRMQLTRDEPHLKLGSARRKSLPPQGRRRLSPCGANL